MAASSSRSAGAELVAAVSSQIPSVSPSFGPTPTLDGKVVEGNRSVVKLEMGE